MSAMGDFLWNWRLKNKINFRNLPQCEIFNLQLDLSEYGTVDGTILTIRDRSKAYELYMEMERHAY